MGKIVVIGSMSMDFVVETEIVPVEGETVIGNRFSVLFGGKGANQAIAASRLENEVLILGCVGKDAYGEMIIDNFNQNKVNTSAIWKKDTSTGSAHITIKDGDNRIIIVEGANAMVDIEAVQKHQESILSADLVIMQQEIPEETVKYVIDYCYEHQVKVLLNPAPARKIEEGYIEKLDYIIPNELEFEVTFPKLSREEALSRYPNKLIITLGDEGAIYHDGNHFVKVQAQKCEVVDTTGAGDCFVAAFSSSILKGKTIEKSIQSACVASSIAIGKLGAQAGLPTAKELEEKIKNSSYH